MRKILDYFELLCTEFGKQGGYQFKGETIQGRILFKEMGILLFFISLQVREWLPYDDYETPDAIEATELSWPTPTIQRLWFGTVQEDKQKRIQAFLSCMHCDELPHGNLPPHMLIMACVLRYDLQNITSFSPDPTTNSESTNSEFSRKL